MRKASHDTGRPDGLSMCSHWDRAGWKPQALERSTRTLPRGHELDLTPGNGTLYTCDFGTADGLVDSGVYAARATALW